MMFEQACSSTFSWATFPRLQHPPQQWAWVSTKKTLHLVFDQNIRSEQIVIRIEVSFHLMAVRGDAYFLAFCSIRHSVALCVAVWTFIYMTRMIKYVIISITFHQTSRCTACYYMSAEKTKLEVDALRVIQYPGGPTPIKSHHIRHEPIKSLKAGNLYLRPDAGWTFTSLWTHPDNGPAPANQKIQKIQQNKMRHSIPREIPEEKKITKERFWY